MNHKKFINLVFTPISVFHGMAGTQRLQNLIYFLLNYKHITITNLIIQDEKKFKEKYHSLMQKVNHKIIKYNFPNPIKFILHYFQTFSILRILLKKGEMNVLYQYGYPNFKNIAIIIFAKFIGFKIIFDIVEDNSTIQVKKTFFERLNDRTSLFFFNRLHLLCNACIGISFHIVQKLNFVSKGRFPVLHIPVSINPNINYKLQLNQKSILKNVILFYGGSFGLKDGLGYLLKAFDIVAEKRRNVKLVLTGKGSEHDMIVFREQFKKLKYKSLVDYKGYIDYYEYITLMNQSDILCVTRTNSTFANAGFPFKLAEMLATGKPVIVSKVSDVESYLDHKSAYIIEPENIESLSEAIFELINNPKLRESIGSIGKEKALKFFNAEKHVQNLLEVFNNL